MDEQRAEFEAWAKSAGWPHSWGYSNTDESGFDSASWDVWQAATQRQQDRIAELEADIAHKNAYAEQLGRLLFKAGAERQELEAQVQALSLDAGRLDWIAMHGSFGVDSVTGLPGGNGQKLKAATREAIDAAIAAGKGEG